MIYIDLDRYVFCRLVSIFRVVLVLGWLCGCMDRWENGPGSRKHLSGLSGPRFSLKIILGMGKYQNARSWRVKFEGEV